MAKTRKTYTREFKTETVKLITERGESVSQVALDMGIHGGTLYKWVRTLSAKPEPAGRTNQKTTRRRMAFLLLHSWA